VVLWLEQCQAWTKANLGPGILGFKITLVASRKQTKHHVTLREHHVALGQQHPRVTAQPKTSSS